MSWESTGWLFTAEWKSMALNKFLSRLGLKTLLILVNLLVISYSLVYVELTYTPLVLGFLAAVQVADLWRFVRRTKDELTRFLQSIQNRDFSMRFGHNEIDPSEKKLHMAFHLILDRIQESELERQGQYLYLKSVVENIPTGILALNEKEEIDLVNPEARALLEIPEVANWKKLRSANTNTFEMLLQLKHGESRLVETKLGGVKKYLSVSLYFFKLHDKQIRLFTLKDIASEIDQKELEAWIKLTRVLTHEIMNSVTPLLSLVETMISVLKKQNGRTRKLTELTDETIEDMVESLSTIQLRSNGLLRFVEDYRKFTRTPELHPEPINPNELLTSVLHLMSPQLKKYGIETKLKLLEKNVVIPGDRKLLDQVFINLLTNSCQALDGVMHPKIEVTITATDIWLEVCVKDNGCGISADKLEQIFIPFFSTKKEGSGIGLSLSRQIIHKHKGSINARSEPGSCTEMVVKLPVGSNSNELKY